MIDEMVLDEARQLETLLPRITRSLFTLEADHPANELPVAQLRVCSILQGGLRTISALSEELGTSASAITQIADRLEKAGVVERVALGEDRRQRKLRLTEHGAAWMRSRRDVRIRNTAGALQRLSAEQRQEILAAVHTLLEAAVESRPHRMELVLEERLLQR